MGPRRAATELCPHENAARKNEEESAGCDNRETPALHEDYCFFSKSSDAELMQ